MGEFSPERIAELQKTYSNRFAAYVVGGDLIIDALTEIERLRDELELKQKALEVNFNVRIDLEVKIKTLTALVGCLITSGNYLYDSIALMFGEDFETLKKWRALITRAKEAV